MDTWEVSILKCVSSLGSEALSDTMYKHIT